MDVLTDRAAEPGALFISPNLPFQPAHITVSHTPPGWVKPILISEDSSPEQLKTFERQATDRDKLPADLKRMLEGEPAVVARENGKTVLLTEDDAESAFAKAAKKRGKGSG